MLLGAEHVHGYFLPFIHYVGEAANGEYVTDNVCRLFRNDERIKFRGTIHEEAASSIWALADGKIAYAALPVQHYGYLEDELRRKDKTARNLKLIHEALRHDPASLPLQYALGTEYYQLGEYGTAADVLLPLLKSAPADPGYFADIYLKTAYALQSSGRAEEAKAVYKEGLRLFPDFTDLLESCAALLLEEGQLLEPYHLLKIQQPCAAVRRCSWQPGRMAALCAIAASCGRVPQLDPAAENALRQSGNAAAAGGRGFSG